jgi:hypothetical protein
VIAVLFISLFLFLPECSLLLSQVEELNFCFLFRASCSAAN